MTIQELFEQLQGMDDSSQMLCVVPSAGVTSRIDIVGQVLEHVPGVVLGAREPYLREKTLSVFKRELTTFGARFDGNDFLMKSIHDLSEQVYNVRYFAVTQVKYEGGEVVLYAGSGELEHLSESHHTFEHETD